MASLYKRYIPPKSIPDQPEVSGSVSRPENPPAPTKPIETKRKRERSQEEVAERKAKKLKKKGIDPATVEQSKPVPIAKDGEENRDVGPNIQTEVHETEVKETASIAPHGEFSHVNSVKKRRKLEKEARAARKAIAKAQNASKHQEVVDDGASSLGDSMAIDEAKSTEHLVPEKTVSTRLVEDAEAEDGASEAGKRNKQQKDVPQEDDHKNHVHDANEAELPAVKPKKRRHKLEAVFADTTVDEAETVGNDQHLQKHVNVLDKFQKSVNRSSQRPEETHEEEEIRPSQTIVKDLELPEPEDEPMPEFTSVDETLPPWLAKPTVVSAEKKATFQDLGLDNEITGRLAKLGFSTALPVQQALVPLLLRPGISGSMFPPGTETVLPDVAVNAPTGSGKTIAYLLPIIESLRQSQYRGRLGALVVVPTRELVLQVAAVAESLAKGHGLKVGMSTGTGKFRDEQERLIKGSIRYDPAEYSKLMQKAKYQINPPDEDSEDFEGYLAEIGLADSREELRLDDAVNCLVEHVPIYESAIDILVATPGRLSEHLNNTLGFTLVHVQWLVIDEADKLLDHEHREFLESLHTELTRAKRSDEQDAREKYLRQQGLWDEREERQLRKVVLSATMTKDISKLASLRLQRPQLVVVRGAESQAVVGAAYDGRNEGLTGDGFELPPTLTEYCVPVGDGSEKPLVAVELIASRIFKEVNWMRRMANPLKTDNRADSPDDEDASSVSDESSILSSDDSTSSSDTDSSTDPSDDETSNDEKDQPELPFFKRVQESTQQPAETTSSIKAATVLIFTSSNESASRLAHLLRTLKPDWSPRITTLVKSKQGSARIRCKLDEPAIVISTDRAARGLDSFSDQKGAKRLITHVLQYDVPRSITSYVHRVGRTARAGNKGDAWTLYTHAEARWFVNETIKPETVKRAGMVERIKLFMANDELRQRYGKILAEMKEEVVGGGGT